MGTQLSAAAASTASIDPLLTLVLGATFTLVGGLIGIWFQSIREHRKWLRERRFEAYRDFMYDMAELSLLLLTAEKLREPETAETTPDTEKGDIGSEDDQELKTLKVQLEVEKARAAMLKRTAERTEAWIIQSRRASEAVSMLGPRAVNAAGQDWVRASERCIAEYTEANVASMSKGRWQFLMAVGKELGSKNVGDTPPVGRPL